MNRIQNLVSLATLILGLCLGVSAQTYSGDYAVIVNPKNPAENISSTQLRKYVLGEEKFWSGRIPVSLILQDDRSVERQFVLTKVLKMSQADFRQHWSTLIFRGAAVSEPMAVPSNGLAAGLVQGQEGALCVIRADNLPRNNSIKVLRVDGKLPGDPGYPLR